MTNWYTSDLHLNHVRLIESKFRNFDDEVAMNCKILENINTVVQPDDHLYILGDLSMSNQENDIYTEEWLKQIRCKTIIVIQGNHDRAKILDRLKEHKVITNWHPWLIIKDNAFHFEFNVAMFHHPVMDYHSSKEAVMCLHGHSHGTFKYPPVDLFDVGLDVWNFKPVTVEQVLSRYYGHHVNPFLGYRDTYLAWSEAYKEFWRKQDEQR